MRQIVLIPDMPSMRQLSFPLPKLTNPPHSLAQAEIRIDEASHHFKSFSKSPYLRSTSLIFLYAAMHPAERSPCFVELPADAALPSAVFGPVERSHGRQILISSACRCRSSDVQCRAMLYPIG